MRTICVIGGGASGMMAAYSASLNKNARVVLLEKNQRLGRKLLITGKGRCNVTNMGDLDDYMENIPHNSAFLYSAFSAFNNYDLLSLFNENGLETKVERGMRVFPASDKAQDVVDFFEGILRKQGVTVNCGKNVNDVSYNGVKKVFTIKLDNGTVIADAVIIATGGLSYPQTGSTGDGYKIAKRLGHSVTKLYPSLVGLKVKEGCVGQLAGLSLKNISVAIEDSNGKKVYDDFGEMLFTHTGVSGPVILSGSARIARQADIENFKLIIDLKPALDEKKLDIRILKDFNKNKNKDLLNALDELLPKSLIPVIIDAAGLPERKKTNEITKAERKSLINALKSFTLTATGMDGFKNAVITSGGVSVNEINPKTMESKLVNGLFFSGEIIDADAYTGGFNLQIAFSTGFLAGKYAARLLD